MSDDGPPNNRNPWLNGRLVGYRVYLQRIGIQSTVPNVELILLFSSHLLINHHQLRILTCVSSICCVWVVVRLSISLYWMADQGIISSVAEDSASAVVCCRLLVDNSCLWFRPLYTFQSSLPFLVIFIFTTVCLILRLLRLLIQISNRFHFGQICVVLLLVTEWIMDTYKMQ